MFARIVVVYRSNPEITVPRILLRPRWLLRMISEQYLDCCATRTMLKYTGICFRISEHARTGPYRKAVGADLCEVNTIALLGRYA